MTLDFKKIMVLALAGAGDALMATPFLKELRLAFPRAQIDVLVLQGAVARAVLDGNPNINNLMLHNFVVESPWRSLQFCLHLRRSCYDTSFSLMPQNRFAYNVIAWLIGARMRIGFDYTVNCDALSRWLLTHCIQENESLHLVDNNLRLLPEILGLSQQRVSHHLDFVTNAEAHAIAERFLQSRNLQGRRLIGFHPGSGTTKNLALKRWDPARWVELSTLLARQYFDASLLLFGTPDEAPLRAEIITGSRLPTNIMVDAGNLSLQVTAALLRRMQVMVCIDGLLAHLAAAQGVPCVALFGPTPAHATYPYGAPHRITRLDLPCSPCYHYSRHGIRCINPVHLQCLKELTPQMVEEAVSELISGAK